MEGGEAEEKDGGWRGDRNRDGDKERGERERWMRGRNKNGGMKGNRERQWRGVRNKAVGYRQQAEAVLADERKNE